MRRSIESPRSKVPPTVSGVGDATPRRWTRESIDELSSIIERNRPLLTSRDLPARQVAAAGLVRCRRHLLATTTLVDSDLVDTAGAHVRAIFETWTYSCWLLYEPDEAVDNLVRGYKKHVGDIDRHAGLGLPDVGGWSDVTKPLNLWETTARVGELLAARSSDESTERPRSLYNVLFRNESARGSHGALASVLGHLILLEDRSEVVAVRREAGNAGRVALELGASLVAHLGSHVFEAFGVSDLDLVVLVEGLPLVNEEQG